VSGEPLAERLAVANKTPWPASSRAVGQPEPHRSRRQQRGEEHMHTNAAVKPQRSSKRSNEQRNGFHTTLSARRWPLNQSLPFLSEQMHNLISIDAVFGLCGEL